MVRRDRPKQRMLDRRSGEKTGSWKRTPRQTPKGIFLSFSMAKSSFSERIIRGRGEDHQPVDQAVD